MLRFSDSMPGAVSIALITYRKMSGGLKSGWFYILWNRNWSAEVKHLNPLSPKDIELQSLARRLTTSPDLKHITTVVTGR